MPVAEREQAIARLQRYSHNKPKGKPRTGPKTPSRIKDACTTMNRHCRGNGLTFMYTLTSREPITDIADMDRHIHRLTEKLTEARVRPWAVARERTQAGNWHAHLALSSLMDLQRLIRWWGVGFVDPPKPVGRKSWRTTAGYLRKSFGQLPPGVRFAFYSKGSRQTKCDEAWTIPQCTPWEAFLAALSGVNLSRILRFQASSRFLVVELHDELPSSGENKAAMARLGRFAMHLARQARTRVSPTDKSPF